MPTNPGQVHDAFAESEEVPVFVTVDGRPRRMWRWSGRMVAVATAAWVASIAVGGSGFGSLPALPIQVGHGPPAATQPGLQTAAMVHSVRDRRGRVAWTRQRHTAAATADRIRRTDRDT